jgi:hypothetical protein
MFVCWWVCCLHVLDPGLVELGLIREWNWDTTIGVIELWVAFVNHPIYVTWWVQNSFARFLTWREDRIILLALRFLQAFTAFRTCIKMLNRLSVRAAWPLWNLNLFLSVLFWRTNRIRCESADVLKPCGGSQEILLNQNWVIRIYWECSFMIGINRVRRSGLEGVRRVMTWVRPGMLRVVIRGVPIWGITIWHHHRRHTVGRWWVIPLWHNPWHSMMHARRPVRDAAWIMRSCVTLMLILMLIGCRYLHAALLITSEVIRLRSL